jgi:DNA polymerase-3 subunit gamma/tau
LSEADTGRSAAVAFARKYRPHRFDEVVGQEAVGRTIRGALRAGQIPSAFLFAGPRGVGKTTMARLLAKALNCTEAEEPTPDPCGACDTCTAVADGHALDVIEVDAASHNGVDDVRSIRERVAHLPAAARFKVYILDEAHMFSTAAWNAFLKTLEEPPAHVRFVFATTEPEKVPETIISRCQRFDFRRIRTDDIVSTLRSIIDRENQQRDTPLEVGDAALGAVARFARGGLRDAESLLEQALLAGEGTVREEDLAALLGTVPREMVRACLEAAADGDAATALEAYGRVHEAGGDAATFLGQSLEMLRELTTISVAGDTTRLVDADEGERAILADLAGRFGLAGSLRATQILAESIRLVRTTDEGRAMVEAGLVRVSLGGGAMTLPEVLDSLADLEKRLAAGGGSRPDPREPATPAPSASAAPPARGELFRGAGVPADGAVLDLDEVRRQWPAVQRTAKDRVLSLGAFLAPGKPVLLSDEVLTLSFPPAMSFHRRQCEESERRKALEDGIEEVLGRRLKVHFETGDEPDDEPVTAAASAPARPESFDRLGHDEVESLRDTPAVKALEEQFKVRMVKVGRKPQESGLEEPGEEEDS